MIDLAGIDLTALAIVRYPDPRLRGPCEAVTDFGPPLRALAERMFEVMYAARGVGLAAPQVGLPLRLFVANPSGEKGPDERVYANPQILSQAGTLNEEEGCLSLPGMNVRIKRFSTTTLSAVDLEGKPFEQTGEGLLARAFQHETDHINGILIADRMTMVAKRANRRLLAELEEKFHPIA